MLGSTSPNSGDTAMYPTSFSALRNTIRPTSYCATPCRAGGCVRLRPVQVPAGKRLLDGQVVRLPCQVRDDNRPAKIHRHRPKIQAANGLA